MSDMYAVPKEKLDAIADAINLKRDTVGGMEIDDMPLQIGLIEGGGEPEIVYEYIYENPSTETTNGKTTSVFPDAPSVRDFSNGDVLIYEILLIDSDEIDTTEYEYTKYGSQFIFVVPTEISANRVSNASGMYITSKKTHANPAGAISYFSQSQNGFRLSRSPGYSIYLLKGTYRIRMYKLKHIDMFDN